MRKTVSPLVILGLLALFAGCGEGEDFQAGNRLTVTSITDEGGNSTPIFKALETTDDSGMDGQPGTNDEGEDDGFPDAGEAIVELISNDLAKVKLQNEERLGVDPGVDLQLFRMDFTYRDANGNTRDFAPARSVAVTGTIPNNGTLEATVELIPVEMKVNGLRGIFLFGTDAEVSAVSSWSVIVDAYARDVRNDDTVHAQGRITVIFVNPMVVQVGSN